jgi:hypothetical protein
MDRGFQPKLLVWRFLTTTAMKGEPPRLTAHQSDHEKNASRVAVVRARRPVILAVPIPDGAP